MKRKIIQIGRNTKIMSLPSKWAGRYNLQKGEELAVEERGSTLLVTAPSAQNTLEVTLDFRNRADDDALWNRLIWRRLVAAYVKGADTVTVLYTPGDTFVEKKIEEYVMDLNGFAILHKTKGQFLLKDVSPTPTKDLDEILQRMFFVLREMSEFVRTAIVTHAENPYGAFLSMEINLNKLTYLCLRIINRNGLFEYQKNNSIYRILTLLEATGDQYRRMIKRYLKSPMRVRKHVIQAMEAMHQFFLKIQHLYYAYNEKTVQSFYADYKVLGKTLPSLNPLNLLEEGLLSYLLGIRELIESVYEEILVLNT